MVSITEPHTMQRRSFLELLGLSALSTASPAQTPEPDQAPRDVLPLSGQWEFALDRADAGVKEQWFSRPLKDRISLPGILQAQGYGDEIGVDTPWVAALPRDMRWDRLPQYQAYTKPGHVEMPYLSQPPRHYLGVAWYQRELEIPEVWSGKRIVLTLERTRWETTVFVDGKQIGSCRTLVAPHIYDLGALAAGKRSLSVRIDNRMILPYRPDGHSVSDSLGATWNGIVGKIELAATSPVWIEDAQVYPDIVKRTPRIRIEIGNSTGKAGSGEVIAGAVRAPVSWDASGGKAELEAPLGPEAKYWSEFTPALEHLTLKLTGGGADDVRHLTFGLREIRREGVHMLLNRRVIDLRATHFGGDFPLTGFPATDVATWKRIIGVCKAWGLNGMRFHSWCPPEAAFSAADEMGFYLQPECGMWNSFDAGGKMLAVLEDETARMIKAYGNHPSFLLIAATNEPAGGYIDQLPGWETKWRAADPRRLWTDGTGRPVRPRPGQPYASDYIITPARGARGWFGNDYERMLAGVEVPALGHEIGQYCAYPDFSVIEKFKGYLRPGNYEIFRDSAAAHGLLKKNKELAHASGRFQLLCYKEEIEANLRTPSYSGVELLDLHDYLGQGTALIGLLDTFWESKGYATAEEFSRFCGPTVPLARLRQRVFTTADSLNADVELAHFGAAPLAEATPEWRIENAAGAVVAKGEWPTRGIPIGKNIPLGSVTVDLSKLPAPHRYKLVVGLRGKRIENDWSFWLYPAAAGGAGSAGVLITSAWPEAEARLAAGGKVLFQPKAQDLDASNPPISTTPIFWNRLMNPNGPWMLGIWCDAKHPALAGFPTEAHCDFQWTDLFAGVHALNLDSLPRELDPVVQPIDDWNRNFKLGLLYECKVGSGRLAVCGIDLNGERPGAAALRKSLLDYMAGNRFQPTAAVSAADLGKQWVKA
jgi:hypothetical protein